MRIKDELLVSGLSLADQTHGGMIELIETQQDEDLSQGDMPEDLPVLPVRNTVLFPGVVLPITVGRKKSIALVKEAYKNKSLIGVVAQKNVKTEDPEAKDLYQYGTLARILKLLVLPDGNTTIIIQGKARFKVNSFTADEPFITCSAKILKEQFPKKNKELKALMQSLKDAAVRIMKLNPEIPQEAQVALDNIESSSFLTHFLSSNINAEVKSKQKLLEINGGIDRATVLLEFMMKDIQMLEIKREIHNKVHTDIDQQQRDYFLRQQIKTLQEELGQEGPEKEVTELRARGAKKLWPEDVLKHFNKELDKLSRMNPMSAEFPVTMNYVEFMIDMPWGKMSEDNFDLKRAKKVLDQDHFGLEKVKTRILEYLAVLKLKQNLRGPILCLYGPPGVGKTSLGKSVAKALGREYVRMSLGGLHDEAEIRGHRKTYIGAMAGKILQNIKKAKTSNPVFVLDEIDKIRTDFRGDPSSALLEVLDPEQNNAFADNYLEVDYDLSQVLFIATSNSLDTISPPLRDRMEIIEISGYTVEEKTEIAKRHLIPKQKEENGLMKKDATFAKDAIVKVIEDYTRESGVRSLERKLGSVIRNIAKSKAMEEEFETKVTKAKVEDVLGAPVFDKEIYQDNKIAGVVTGLAWTRVGGEILFVESSLSRGKGKLVLSGQLGSVMKESAQAAISYLRSNAEELGIDYRLFDQYDLHVHFPAGAVPKDGPSAGITIMTSLASIYTQRKVRARLAMTGEITLRGKVLPVGGIKEKMLAAKRAGIKDIILSERNKKDIDEMSDIYLKGLTFHFVHNVAEVLEIALLKDRVPNPMKLTIVEEPKKA